MNEGLAISGLSHSFLSESGARVQALQEVSFSVPKGEIAVVLGASGCGKTTLLHLVGGFAAPCAGTILLDGTPPQKRQCTVFQSPALFEWLTVFQNVEFGLKRRHLPKGARCEAVAEMLELVHLTEFAGAYPDELSGGMQQRAALARALVTRPALLLLDEPFAALDAQLREQMQALLLSIWKELQFTALFVTHDIEEALRIAHRIILLSPHPGRVQRVFELPQSAQIRDTSYLGEVRAEIRQALAANR